MKKICNFCNKEFDGYRTSKLCSDTCREQKELQRGRERRKTKEYKLYRKEHRKELNKSQRKYYASNKEKILEKSKAQYAENPEPAKLQARKWAQNNKKRVARNNKAWVKANHEKVRASQHKHRSAKRGNGGSYTAAEWTALCEKYNNRCLCCDRRRKLTADHVIPVSKGGTSNISNIQPLCGPCNSRKGAKTIDFRKKRRHGNVQRGK